MQEIIKHMLAVEEKARQIVKSAEESAHEIRLRAQEQAQEKRRQMRSAAQEEGNRLVESARTEAQKQKRTVLDGTEVKIRDIKDRCERGKEEAIEIIVKRLLAD